MIETFVRRRVLTTVLVLIAVILGALSYGGLGVRRFPEIEFPFVTVYTVYQGASPAEVESEITKRIEDAVVTISGIEEINSSSQQGLSLVFVQFGLEEDVDIKAVDVRNKIDRILPLLPEAADEPVPQKFEIGSLPVVDLALYGPQDPNDLYRLADEELKPLLTQIAGVADVELSGGQEREIQLLLDMRKLRRHRVAIGMVVAAIRAANVNVPAGHITEPGREFVLRTPGRVERPEEIEQIQVPTAGGGILTVGDLGRVVDTYEEARTINRFNGQPAIGLAVQARTDANEVEVVDGVNAALPRLRAMLPAGARLDVARDTSIFIRGALANVWQNMLIGVCLTAVVIYLFLGSPRATVIVAIVMPAAVVAAFVGMRAAGFTLNIISLTGMAIVIGVLVNNAILVLENVNRLVDEGTPPADAAVDGTRDIALAIFSSTATNLVVFLPIAFMGEIIGRFFKELGLTVVFATVASLLISFSLTPMMCGLLLRGNQRGRRENGFFSFSFDSTFGRLAGLWQAAFERARRVYLGMLDWCLRHRLSTVFITLIAFVASFGPFAVVGLEFFPPSDEGRFRVSLEAPVGTPLEVTDAVVRRVEAQVREVPYLERYMVRVGRVAAGMSGRTEGVDLAEISVTIADRADRPKGLDEMLNELRPKLADIPSARVLVAKEEMGGPNEPAIGIEVVGDDLAALKRVAGQVMKIVEGVPGTAGVSKSWQSGQPELRVIPLQEQANRHGVNVRLLAEEVRAYVEGTVASEFLTGDENYDVVVKLREEDRQWAADVDRMFISSAITGGMVPIGQVADVRREAGSTLITRKDRTRLVTVTAGLTGERPVGKIEADVRRRISEEVAVPEGVTLNFGGQTEMSQKKYLNLEDISAYKITFELSNYVWDIVSKWNYFAKATVGKQFVEAVDSISANISEGLGDSLKRKRLIFIDTVLALCLNLSIGLIKQ